MENHCHLYGLLSKAELGVEKHDTHPVVTLHSLMVLLRVELWYCYFSESIGWPERVYGHYNLRCLKIRRPAHKQIIPKQSYPKTLYCTEYQLDRRIQKPNRIYNS